MRKKAHKQQRTSSPDTLLKTSKKKDIELTEKELGKVSGGSVAGDLSSTVQFKFTTTTKDKVDF